MAHGIGPERKVLDLGARLWRRECDERGKAAVSVRWAGAVSFNRKVLNPSTEG
jgi:hypothetical protein